MDTDEFGLIDLELCRRALSTRPDIRYFDDPAHKTLLHHRNVGALVEPYGFRVVKLVPALLPSSIKSGGWPLLLRLYLNLPVRPLAARMYVVAERG